MTKTMALKLAASRKKAKEDRKIGDEWKRRLAFDVAAFEAQVRARRYWADKANQVVYMDV